MFYRNVSDALKIIVNDIDPKINFKSWDSEIHNIGDDEEYPMFILAPMVNVMSTAVDELTDAYSISWLVIESLNEEANQDEVMIELNNMSELSKQIFLIFENTYGYNTKAINGERMDFNIIDPYTAQAVTMEKGDNRTGIAAQFTIENKDNNELCSALDCAGDGIADCDPVTVIDSDGVTVNVVESGGVFACTLSIVTEGRLYKRPQKPQGNTSFAAGDAKSNLDTGVYNFNTPANPEIIVDTKDVSFGTDYFLKLNSLNVFGNDQRLTLEDGTPITRAASITVKDTYMIDHLTGYGWINTDIRNLNWTDALTAAGAASYFDADANQTYTDFFLPSRQDLESIYNSGGVNPITVDGMAYAFMLVSSFLIHSSTTVTSTTSANYRLRGSGPLDFNTKTTTTSTTTCFCRLHY